MTKKISRGIGLLYKLLPFVTTKILTNVYYAIIYPFLLYGIAIWGAASKNLLNPILEVQKKNVRLATFKDFYPVIPGPLEHTPPLFYKLNLLNIFVIYNLQVGKLVYDSLNQLGPIQGILNFTSASEIHSHSTRFSIHDNLHINPARTCRFGLRTLNVVAVHLWATIPNNIKNCSTKQAFSKQLKTNLINSYTSL